ncbi:MAG: hypothetical protein Q7K54_05215 [Candidatus Parcubacteria bacterium]|nr:hypothetical protein [Candidatus Parcubacteria bacterium]
MVWGLKEGTYVPLIIPGGISNFTEPEMLPKNFKVAKEQIQFFLDHFDSIKRVILINHEDCRGYESLKTRIGMAFLSRIGSMMDRQKLDLQKVAKILAAFSSGRVAFELYYAKFADGNHNSAVFEKIV